MSYLTKFVTCLGSRWLPSSHFGQPPAQRQFIFLANAGQIRHRRPEEQTNQALCLNLVTNLVVVWNTVYVDKAIEHLTKHGLITDQDDLSKTSPTQRAHINPYGRYTFHNEQAHDSLRPLHC